MVIKRLLFSLLFLLSVSSSAPASEPDAIITTIKPLHSLVSGIVGDTNSVELLVDKTTSPHDFQLKPSDVKRIQKARVIFYIDDHFESFLVRALKSKRPDAVAIPLMDTNNLKLLPQREGGVWEGHNHAHDDHDDHKDDHNDHKHEDKEHAHDDHDDHKDDHDDHKHEDKEHAHDDHDDHKDDHDDHKHGMAPSDAHIWLDPYNAKIMVLKIADQLAAIYPENAAIYDANAKQMISKLNNLNQVIEAELSDVKKKPFIVFHDGYQYFEKAYGLEGVGSITFEPHESPSFSRIKAVRERLNQSGARCIFREPQFSDRLVTTVTEGTVAKSGILDPLGSDLENGPGLYFTMMQNLATALKTCLT